MNNSVPEDIFALGESAEVCDLLGTTPLYNRRRMMAIHDDLAVRYSANFAGLMLNVWWRGKRKDFMAATIELLALNRLEEALLLINHSPGCKL